MEPIVLTENGQTLNPCVRSEDDIFEPSFYGWEHKNMNQDLLGAHAICMGAIQLRLISETHNALCCNHCNLRIEIPTDINTLGKLRQWCAQQIAEKELWEKRLRTLWGLVPFETRDKIEADIATEERKTVAAVSDAVRELAKGLTPESAEIVRAADEDRRRIRKIIGDK